MCSLYIFRNYRLNFFFSKLVHRVSKLTLNPQEVNCNHYICRKCETNVFPTWGWVVYRLPFRLCLCLPSRLWQAAADCPLMPLLPSRLWQASADFADASAAFLLMISADASASFLLMAGHCWLSADASAAFPLMAIHCCLSPAKPLLP
jgi:hypothetical protein